MQCALQLYNITTNPLSVTAIFTSSSPERVEPQMRAIHPYLLHDIASVHIDNSQRSDGYPGHLGQLPADEVHHVVQLPDELLVVTVDPLVARLQHRCLRLRGPVDLSVPGRKSCAFRHTDRQVARPSMIVGGTSRWHVTSVKLLKRCR